MRTLLLLPGVLGTSYKTGGGADMRGDETQATSYGSNDRDGTVDTTLTSAPQLTGYPYTNASNNGAAATGKFASAAGAYTDAGGSVDLTAQQYQDLGSGYCETTTGIEATNSAGTAATCQADCSKSTTCTGYQTDGSATCKIYTGAVNLAKTWDGAGSAPASCMKKVGGALTSSTDTNAMGCSGEGFVCDFKEISKMGNDYKPKDFVWKVVDPDQRYRTGGGYSQQTLQCQVDITYADEATAGTTAKLYGSATTDVTDWFYVPMGQHNVGGDYCDIEAIRRDFKDSELYMNDTIHIRGETARLNNDEASDYDLIGEFFDLICGCMTTLSTEASISNGLKQSSSALLTVMTSTGTQRELMVELLLFSDDLLLNEIAFPQTFPDNSQRFYFLARHTLDNDWDAKLQINKCIACSLSDDCTTDADTDARVIFYDQCATILGGPQERMVASNSWYHDSSVAATPGTKNFKPQGQWASKDKTTCPYAAKGFQKFRLAERDTMKVTCQITACDTLPCPPCSRRRLDMMTTRQLQQQNAVDISMFLSMDGNDDKNTKVVGQEQEEEKKEKKQGAAFFILLILALLLALGSVFAVSRALKKNKNIESNRSVKPLEA